MERRSLSPERRGRLASPLNEPPSLATLRALVSRFDLA
jgi:hypothetical protein